MNVLHRYVKDPGDDAAMIDCRHEFAERAVRFAGLGDALLYFISGVGCAKLGPDLESLFPTEQFIANQEHSAVCANAQFAPDLIRVKNLPR